MIDAARDFLHTHDTLLAWLAWGSGALLLASLLTLPAIAVALPADFIQRVEAGWTRTLPDDDWRRRHPALRWLLRVVKNAAGAILAVAGLAMLVLPGQGLVTLAVALLLLDLPGKRRLERRIIGSRRLINPINRLRRRMHRPPLIPLG